MKVWGTARVVPATPELIAQLAPAGYRARADQVVLISVDAWNINCPQHIPQKVNAAEVAPVIAALQARIAELEAENCRLKEQ